MSTLKEILQLKESEDRIEFKEAKDGNFAFNGGSRKGKKRRRCICGYVIALANEGGGRLVLGVSDKHPHEVVGTKQRTGAIGKLTQDIYDHTGIRVSTIELFDDNKLRVLVIEIPSRPVGRYYCFEDVPLMRVGDELLAMPQTQIHAIINESELDFSSRADYDFTLIDLDDQSIARMKEIYARKQNNDLIKTMPNEQVLSDLNLYNGGELNNGCLLLLGKREVINQFLPNAAVRIEIRSTTSQIKFDRREVFEGPLFLLVDEVWGFINSLNKSIPVADGPYIFDLPMYNEEVIREALVNALVHRSYRLLAETVIKIYPDRLVVTSPGGFPNGVTVDNIILINSTPRNRVLADVFARTGIVERSGQGVDKIFYNCIRESRGYPDYTNSDDFQVELVLPISVEDPAFLLFIRDKQSKLDDSDMLSLFEIMELDKIRRNEKNGELDIPKVKKLVQKGLVEKKGRTKGTQYRLSKDYFQFTGKEAKYALGMRPDREAAFYAIRKFFEDFESAKMGNFVSLLSKFNFSREQVKNLVYELRDVHYLETRGSGRATRYFLSSNAVDRETIIQEALKLGLEELKKRGKRKNTQ